MELAAALVFINACESLAIAPDDLVGYLGAFIGTAQAAGVIGTETSQPADRDGRR